MFSELLATICTLTERNLILSELEIAKGALFKDESVREEILNTQIRAETAQFLKGLFAHPQKEQLLEECKQALLHLVLIELTIPVAPSLSMITLVHEWLLQQVGPCVIDFHLDPRLIAGATISYQGNYYDGSVRKRFTELVEKELQAQTHV